MLQSAFSGNDLSLKFFLCQLILPLTLLITSSAAAKTQAYTTAGPLLPTKHKNTQPQFKGRRPMGKSAAQYDDRVFFVVSNENGKKYKLTLKLAVRGLHSRKFKKMDDNVRSKLKAVHYVTEYLVSILPIIVEIKEEQSQGLTNSSKDLFPPGIDTLRSDLSRMKTQSNPIIRPREGYPDSFEMDSVNKFLKTEFKTLLNSKYKLKVESGSS